MLVVLYRFGSSTRKGRNSVTFAETIATAGVDNAGLSLTTPEHGVLDYPNWLTALENPPRYQHSLITTTPTVVFQLNFISHTSTSKVKGTGKFHSLALVATDADAIKYCPRIDYKFVTKQEAKCNKGAFVDVLHCCCTI